MSLMKFKKMAINRQIYSVSRLVVAMSFVAVFVVILFFLLLYSTGWIIFSFFDTKPYSVMKPIYESGICILLSIFFSLFFIYVFRFSLRNYWFSWLPGVLGIGTSFLFGFWFWFNSPLFLPSLGIPFGILAASFIAQRYLFSLNT